MATGTVLTVVAGALISSPARTERSPTPSARETAVRVDDQADDQVEARELHMTVRRTTRARRPSMAQPPAGVAPPIWTGRATKARIATTAPTDAAITTDTSTTGSADPFPVRRPRTIRFGPARAEIQQRQSIPQSVPERRPDVVGYALAQVGKRYARGGSGPDSFDCSGLVAATYARIGIRLPHQTGALASLGRPVSRAELRPGDLVFPSSGHVGIYIGGGRMVHAATARSGVKVSNLYAFRFARRLTG